MSVIYIHLSGRLVGDFCLSDDDLMYFSPSVESSCSHARAMPLPSIDSSYELPLASSYADAFIKCAKISPHDFLGAFINDYYSYSVRPAFSILLSIESLVKKNPSSRVVVLCAKADSIVLPLLGFKTTESRKGSAHIMGAIISNNMMRIKAFERVEFRFLPGDFLCSNWFRQSFIKLAGFLCSFAYMLKLAWAVFVGRVEKEPIDKLLICRNTHQFRFASSLLGGMQSARIILVPQLAFGSWGEFRKLSKFLEGKKVNLSFKDIFKIFLDALVSHRNMKKAVDHMGHEYGVVNLGDLSCLLDFRKLSLEVSSFFPFFLYQSTLRRFFSKYSPRKVISFEIVGRMAGIEACVAREQEKNLVAVQTVLVSARPHPVFPWASIFYTDSRASETALSDIGTVGFGRVKYVGPPYEISDLFKPPRIGRLVFFSQPYEYDVTLNILACLVVWARENKKSIFLKMHPRDDAKKYSRILSDNPDVLHVENSININEILNSADLAVTRTSSVAKEAIATGCPAVLCMWSKFDQGIRADYIVPELFEDYCSFAEADLLRVLANPEKILRASKNIYSGFFGGANQTDLVRELNHVE